MYFETIVRYSAIFSITKLHIPSQQSIASTIPTVLAPFLDQRGSHNPIPHVQQRVWYLLLRLARALACVGKETFPPYDDMIASILDCLQDLTIIRPTQPSPMGLESTPRLEALWSLFEAMGVFVSSVHSEEKRLIYLKVSSQFFYLLNCPAPCRSTPCGNP